MTDLKPRHLINNALLGALLLLSVHVRAEVAGGGDYVLTKVLIGASGDANENGRSYQFASAFGEGISGQSCADDNAIDTVVSGYFGGHAGNGKIFHLLSTSIDGLPFLQDGVRVGVPLNASLHLTFSEPVNVGTLYDGLSVQIIADHLGQPQSTLAPVQFSADITGSSITITPQTAWEGNTVYNLQPTSGLEGTDGATLAENTATPFLTLLDPKQENVVLMPVGGPNSGVIGLNSAMTPPVNIQVPAQGLSDYALLLVNRDPVKTPFNVDPQVIQTANSRAAATYGPYATPLALTQVTAVNSAGAPLTRLAQTAQVSMALDIAKGAPAYVRVSKLSLWALDTLHQMWVKVPASDYTQGVVSAPVSKFSVFALMGQASGSASDAYVFPNPWRPHGGNAGTRLGQSGTDSGGLTFTNLPSECSIKIYTLAGELVRSLQHSDVGSVSVGQETWDGRTKGGSDAASGIYLWRVESATDGKNGKLIIIR